MEILPSVFCMHAVKRFQNSPKKSQQKKIYLHVHGPLILDHFLLVDNLTSQLLVDSSLSCYPRWTQLAGMGGSQCCLFPFVCKHNKYR